MPDFGPIIFLSPLALVLAVFLHELGHVVFGWAVGFVVTSFGLGTARPLLVVGLGRVRCYVCLVRPLQGITFAFLPRMQPSRLRLIGFVFGGIIANAVSAALALVLARWLPGSAPFWIASAAMNALLAASSLLPLNVRVGKTPLRTDGALAIQALRSAGLSQSAPNVVQTLSTLRGMWTAIGDTLIVRVYCLSAALAWLEMGDVERAETLLLEAQTIKGDAHPYLECLAALVKTNIAIMKEQPIEARAALEVAETYFRETRQPAGLYLVSLFRASIHGIEGDASRMAAELESLAADPVVKSHTEIGLARLVAQVRIACYQADRPAIERHLAMFEADRRRTPSATRDLQVYRDIAKFRSGHAESADDDSRRALTALKTLADEWIDPEDRSVFLTAQSALIEEARQCLPGEEVDRLLESVSPSAQIDGLVRRDRQFRRWGLICMLFNGVALGFVAGSKPTPPVLVLGFLLAVCTGLAVFFLALDWTIGRVVPGLRRYTGIAVLASACQPWLVIVVTLILTIIKAG